MKPRRAFWGRLLADRETFLTITAPLLVAFFASVVSGFIFKGATLWIFILTAFVLVILFSVALSLLAQRAHMRIELLFNARLPLGQMDMQVKKKEQAEMEVANVVKNATTFIYATGSRSRVIPYLTAIEDRLKEPDLYVHYTRILMGDRITVECCQHLCRIFENSQLRARTWISRHSRTDLGYFTVTDYGFYAFFPSPERGAPLENYLRVLQNPRVINFFRTYIDSLARERATEQITDVMRIRQLCAARAGPDGRCPECGVRK